jgi:hypothetical protein
MEEPVDVLIKRSIKEPEIIAKERYERLLRTLELKAPDRVPIGGIGGDIIPYYGGVTWYDLSYNYENENGERVLRAIIKFITEVPQDFPFISVPYGIQGSILAVAFSESEIFLKSTLPYLGPDLIRGPIHDLLQDKWTKWPGRELGIDYHPQFVGGMFLKPEEYKYLVDDPVGFINNVILPRACPSLGKPGSPQWNALLVSIGLIYQKIVNFTKFVFTEISKRGCVGFPITAAHTPADMIGDFMRNPTGAILDMRRYPDYFKAACEALVKPILKFATAIPPSLPVTLALIPLHLNEMLSPKLYNEFYWPYLKKIIYELLNKGYKIFMLIEGDHTPHLDTLLELPKGWGIGWFEKPKNFIKVWETLKGHTIVMGGVPTTLLISGTPEKIEEYVKNLLNNIKPEGGFIVAPTVMDLPKETPIANIRAFINAVEKYGKY